METIWWSPSSSSSSNSSSSSSVYPRRPTSPVKSKRARTLKSSLRPVRYLRRVRCRTSSTRLKEQHQRSQRAHRAWRNVLKMRDLWDNNNITRAWEIWIDDNQELSHYYCIFNQDDEKSLQLLQLSSSSSVKFASLKLGLVFFCTQYFAWISPTLDIVQVILKNAINHSEEIPI